MTLIVASLRSAFPLKDLLAYFNLPRSTFYENLSRKKTDKYAQVRLHIKTIFKKTKGVYGYRRMTYALAAEYNITLNRKTVARLMKEQGLVGKVRRRGRYTSYWGEVGTIADNVLYQNFSATRPFQKMVSDITQFKVGGKIVYLSPLIDLYNAEVVSWKIGTSPNVDMVCSMLEDVYENLCTYKPIVHTDQGFQYQNPRWRYVLRSAGCIPSMSRKGNCLDNAPAESFFGKVKVEFSDGSEYKDVQSFVRALNGWICWYNEERIKESLGMSPAKYRKMKSPIKLGVCPR